jgi:hypothetical protein
VLPPALGLQHHEDDRDLEGVGDAVRRVLGLLRVAAEDPVLPEDLDLDLGVARPVDELLEPAAEAPKAPAAAKPPAAAPAKKARAADRPRDPAPMWFWILAGIGGASMLLIAAILSWERLEIFKMLLASFFPLAMLILAVLGSIVFGLATPAEAAAVGAFGGFLLTVAAWPFINLLESRPLVLALLIGVHAIAGLATAGVNLGTGTLALQVAPRGEAAAYLATNALISGIAAALAPTLAGVSADWLVTQLTTPGGRSASAQISARKRLISGPYGDDLKTIVQPVASAGPSFCMATNTGKFQVGIMPHTPTGWR